MNVLVLGGCGGMGRQAVKTLLAFSEIGSVVIGDINVAAAEDMAAQLGERVSAVQVNVEDAVSMQNALASVDLVLNAVGPFYRFGPTTLKACIEHKVNYIDICDDWEPTLDMLELHEAAEAAGITAIIGLGATPGISNILAAQLINMFDRVDDVYTGWNVEHAVPEEITDQVSAATIHGVQQLTGTIKYYQHGEVVERKPFSRFALSYPGLGHKTMRAVGHPEPITLPRYFPDIKNSVNVFFAPKASTLLLRFLAKLVDWKLLSMYSMAKIIEKLEAGKRDDDGVKDLDIVDIMDNQQEFPPIFVIADGEKDGKAMRMGGTIRYLPPGGMGGATGVPFAIGAALLAKGKILKKGVFAPEGCINPVDFFDVLSKFCGSGGVSVNQLVAIEAAER